MDSSPFSKLSAELRNEIYELALSFENTIFITNTSDYRLKSSTKHPTALLQTCRQIRAEATKMFYANNAFRVCDSRPTEPYGTSNGFTVVQQFFHTIGLHNSNTIKRMRVDIRFDQRDLSRIKTPTLKQINSQIADLRHTARFRNLESFKCVLEINIMLVNKWREISVELDILDFVASHGNAIAAHNEEEHLRRINRLSFKPELRFVVWLLELLEKYRQD